MASEDVRIAAPVHISNDSAQRVAYDLMIIINQQTIDDKQQPLDKLEYWFRLYAQCLRAANGNPLEQILQDDKTVR
ncbi:MAG: hypothetical protein H7X91_03565 [Burkholderiales bacterium]|nr:hypothetical protein [Burkholderiales bacterium]